MHPKTQGLIDRIENMSDIEFKRYLFAKINHRLFAPESWEAMLARFDKLYEKTEQK